MNDLTGFLQEGTPEFSAVERAGEANEEFNRKARLLEAVILYDKGGQYRELADKAPEMGYLNSEHARQDPQGRDMLLGQRVALDFHGGDVRGGLRRTIDGLPEEERRAWEARFGECKDEGDGMRLLGELARTRTEGAWDAWQRREAERKADVEGVRDRLERELPGCVIEGRALPADVWGVMEKYSGETRADEVRESLGRAQAAFAAIQERSHGGSKGDYEGRVRAKADELRERWRGGVHWAWTDEPTEDEYLQQARAEVGSDVGTEVDREFLAGVADMLRGADGRMDERAAAMLAVSLGQDARGEQTVDSKFCRNLVTEMERWGQSALDYMAGGLVKSAAKTGVLYTGPDTPPVYYTEAQRAALATEVARDFSPDVETLRSYVSKALDERLDASAQADMLSAAATKVGTITGDTAPILLAQTLAPGVGGFLAGSAMMFPATAGRMRADAYAEGLKHPELVGNVGAFFETAAEAGFGPLSKFPGVSRVIDKAALRLVGVPVLGRAIGAVQGNAALRYATGTVIGESAGELVGENVVSETGTYLTLNGLRAVGMDLDAPEWAPFLHSWQAMQDARQTGATVAYCALIGLGGVRGDMQRARAFAEDQRRLMTAGMSSEGAAKVASLAERQRGKAAKLLHENRAVLEEARDKAREKALEAGRKGKKAKGVLAGAEEDKRIEAAADAAGAAAAERKARELTAPLDNELQDLMQEVYKADVLFADPLKVRERMRREHELYMSDVEAQTALREGILKAALREAGVLDVKLGADGRNLVHLKAGDPPAPDPASGSGSGVATPLRSSGESERVVEWTDEQLAAFSQYAIGNENLRRMKAIRSAALAIDMAGKIDGRGYAETLPLTAEVAPVAAALAKAKGKMTLDVLDALGKAALDAEGRGVDLLPGVSNGVVSGASEALVERARWDSGAGGRGVLSGRAGAMAMRLPMRGSAASKLVYLRGQTRSVNLVEDAVESMVWRRLHGVGGIAADGSVTQAGREWLAGMLDDMRRVNGEVKRMTGRELMPGLEDAEATVMNVVEYFSHLAQSSFYRRAGSAGLGAEARRHVEFMDAALVSAKLLGDAGAAFNAWSETEEGRAWAAQGGTLAGLLQEAGHEMADLYEMSAVTAENVAAVEAARREARVFGMKSLDEIERDVQSTIDDLQSGGSAAAPREDEGEPGVVPAGESAAGVELPAEVLGDVPDVDGETGEFEVPAGCELVEEPDGRGRGLVGGRCVDDGLYHGSVVGLARVGEIAVPGDGRYAGCSVVGEGEVFVVRGVDGGLTAVLNAGALEGRDAGDAVKVRVFDADAEGMVEYEASERPSVAAGRADAVVRLGVEAFSRALAVRDAAEFSKGRRCALGAEDLVLYYADTEFTDGDLDGEFAKARGRKNAISAAAHVVRHGGPGIVELIRAGKASVKDAIVALEATYSAEGAEKFLELRGERGRKSLRWVRAYARAWESAVPGHDEAACGLVADYVLGALADIRDAMKGAGADALERLERMRVSYEGVEDAERMAEAARAWGGKGRVRVVNRETLEVLNAATAEREATPLPSPQGSAETGRSSGEPEPLRAWPKAPGRAVDAKKQEEVVLREVARSRSKDPGRYILHFTLREVLHGRVHYVATDAWRVTVFSRATREGDKREVLDYPDKERLHFPAWRMVMPHDESWHRATCKLDLSRIPVVKPAGRGKPSYYRFHFKEGGITVNCAYMEDAIKNVAALARVAGCSPVVEVGYMKEGEGYGEGREPLHLVAKAGKWTYEAVIMPVGNDSGERRDYVTDLRVAEDGGVITMSYDGDVTEEWRDVMGCVDDLVIKGEGILHNRSFADIKVAFGNEKEGVRHTFEHRRAQGLSDSECSFVAAVALKIAGSEAKHDTQNSYTIFKKYGLKVVTYDNDGQHYLTGYVEFDNPRKGKGGKGESAAASAGTRDYARIDLASNRQVGALLKETVARLDDIVKKNPAAFEDFLSYEVALLKIKLEAIAAGTFMKAPNGKPTKLTERQWLQVRTRAFKAWFGDWEHDPEHASKVLDENGEPLVVYHFTDSVFTAFDVSKARQNADIPAIFFSSGTEDWAAMGGRVMACYLNIRNPKEGKPIVNGNGREVRDALVAEGYDGTIDRDEDVEEVEYAAFRPEQVKSATENRGTFDGRDADVTHSLALDDEALDGLPEYREAVVQDLVSAVRREVSRMQTVFIGSGAVDEAARELGQINALLKQVYRRCDRAHRAMVQPRIRLVHALGRMLRNGHAYRDALTDAEREELGRLLEDETEMVAGGIQADEYVDDAGNVTVGRTGRRAEAVREARELLAREYAGRKMDEVARAMLREAAAALEAQERDAVRARMLRLVESLLPAKDGRTHRMRRGKVSADAGRRLAAWYAMMVADEDAKTGEMERLSGALAAEEGEPFPDEGKVAELSRELADWAVFGCLGGQGLEQIRRAEAALGDFVLTERTAWGERQEAERKRLRATAHRAERALGKADASKLREITEREMHARHAFGAFAENMMSLSQAFTAMGGLPGMEALGLEGVDVLRDGHRMLKRREDAVSNALGAFMRDELGLVTDREQAEFMVHLRETVRTGIVRRKELRKVVDLTVEEAQGWLDMSREERDARREELEAEASARGAEAENVPAEDDIPLLRDEVRKALHPGERKDGSAMAVRRRRVRTERVWHEEQAPLVASRDQLLNALLTYEQPGYAENARVNGYTPEVLEEIREAVGADVVRFGYFMRGLLEGSGLAEVYEAREGVPFPREELYWPGRFNGAARMDQGADALNVQMGSGAKHGMLITRVRHTDEVDLSLGATNVFLSGCAQVNNYIVFGEFTGKWRRLLAHRGFARSLNARLGETRFIALKQMLDMLDGAGMAEAVTQRSTGVLMRLLQSSKAVAVLAGNALTLAKQWTAMFNGAAYASPGAIVGQLVADRVGAGRMTFWRLLHTDLFRERYKDNRPFVELMRRRESDMKWSALSGWARAGMDAIEKMDVWANCVGMTALYNVEWRRLEAENRGSAEPMAEEEMHEHCMRLVGTALDQVAQPQRMSQRSMMGALGRNNVLVQMSCFMRTDVLNKLGMAVATYERDRARGRGVAGSLLHAWRYVATLSAAEQVVAVLWELLQGQGPEDDDRAAWWVSRMLLGISGGGVANGMPLLGGTVDIVRSMVGGKQWIPLNQLDDTFLDVQGWRRFLRMPHKALFEGKEYTAAEWAVWATDATRRGVQTLGLAGGLTSRTRWVSTMSGLLQSAATATNAVRPVLVRERNVERREERERKRRRREMAAGV